MIRTRDLLLYVLALVFFVSTGAFTFIYSHTTASSVAQSAALFVAETVSAPGTVTMNDAPFDRAAYIERIATKIQAGEGEDPNRPLVPDSRAAYLSAPDEETNEFAVDWCDVPVGIARIKAVWRNGAPTFETREGVQVLVVNDMVRLQLPQPILAAQPSCLSHEVVGISLNGQLIEVHDADRFHSYDETDLIGYALDGFPIYGAGISGATDQCGGVAYPAGGYRYHLSEDRAEVLGCFVGMPAEFLM